MHWLRHKQPAQDLVQFGLMTAAVAIVALAGLQFLSGTIRWYFGDVAPTIAPPAASVPGFPLHKLNMSLTCSDSQLVVGVSTNCQVVLSDPDTLNPVPISGNLSVTASGGQFGGCATLVPVSSSSVQCVGTFSSNQAGKFVLTAKFLPDSNHIQANTDTNPITITVTDVPTLQIGGCPGGTVVYDSPIVCTAALQISGPGASALPGRELSWAVSGSTTGVFTCSQLDAPGSCASGGAAPWATCQTDANGQCSIVFRPSPTYTTATLTVSFGGDQPPVSPAFSSVGPVKVTFNVTTPTQLHDTDAVFDGCPSGDSRHLHCQATIVDTFQAGSPPPPDQDTRSPPTGPTTITIRGSSILQNNTCDTPKPWPGTDHSTCSFDLVKDEDDHDQIQLQFKGDVFHNGDTSSWKDVHFSANGNGG
jgi:hypothetical protein